MPRNGVGETEVLGGEGLGSVEKISFGRFERREEAEAPVRDSGAKSVSSGSRKGREGGDEEAAGANGFGQVRVQWSTSKAS